MPIVSLLTNVPLTNFPATFRQKFVELLAKILHKPVEGISLHIASDANYSYGSTDAPAILLNVKAIGFIGAEENIPHTKAITNFIHEIIGMEPSRVLIHFQNLDATEVGFHGTTVAEHRKKAARK